MRTTDSRLVSLMLCCLAGIALLAGCTVNPVTGRSQLDLMGEAQEIQLGAELYPRYTESSLGAVPEPGLQEYLQQVGTKLTAVSHRPQLPYSFNAVNDPVVNAYALPGGKISITRGLLSRMENEDQLAAVLAHEAGHVTARHSAQQYTRGMLVQALLVGGEIYLQQKGARNRELYRFGGMIGAQLFIARYSRDNERQSDTLAMEYMTKAGYNPTGVVQLMQVLEQQHSREPGFVEQMFASHPMTGERIATARQGVAGLPSAVTNRPFTQQEFRRRTTAVRRARPAYDRLAEARGLLAEDRAGEARHLLQQASGEWPDDGVLRAYLAVAESENGAVAQALRDADRAATSAGQIFFVQMLAGQLFLNEKRYSKSLQLLDRADAVLPNVVGVTLLRGRAYEGMGRRNDAVEQYQKVVQAAPGSDAALHAEERLKALGVAS